MNKKIINRLIIKNHILAFLTCFILINILSIIQYKNISYLIPGAISFILYIFLRKNITKNKNILVNDKMISKKFDLYSKKYYLCLILLFFQLIAYSSNSISLFFNSKTSDLINYIFENSSNVLIILYFLLKNTFQLNCFKGEDKNKNIVFKRKMKKCSIFFTSYTIIVLIFVYMFEKFFVLNPLPIFMIVFISFSYITYDKVVNEYLYVKGKYNKWKYVFIVVFLCLGILYYYFSKDVWLLQPYINTIPNINESETKISYDDKTGIYTIINNNEDFKILQLTDIHLGGSALSYDKDLKALKTVYKLIEFSKPDLVVVTGDLTYPVGLSSFSINNTAPLMEFAAFMRNIGIPWVFTYGNHDTESMAIKGKNEIIDLYMSLSYKTSKNLLYPYVQPNITGRNNQVLEIRNKDNSLNQLIFLLDSNDYVSTGFSDYDYIHDDQVEWYTDIIEKYNEKENEIVSSLVFFHIPIKEFKTAYDLYKNYDKEVKYYFGKNDEDINSTKYDSKIFERAVELQSTKGMFCGHDHYNNISLEYKGIRLTYGMSIDYLVEPGISRKTDQRGATLIISHKDSTIDVKQIPYKEIQ